MTNLAVFASGSGTNAENIIKHFNKNGKSENIKVKAVFCNNPVAGVLQKSYILGVPSFVLPKGEMIMNEDNTGLLVQLLTNLKIDAIILAGYLLKVPSILIHMYPQKIINIHPALLPKYGGKGMYGEHVHNAVIANGEKESGITIHLADEIYDNGRVLFQTSCSISEDDNAQSLADKIHELEQANFPKVIEKYFTAPL